MPASCPTCGFQTETDATKITCLECGREYFPLYPMVTLHLDRQGGLSAWRGHLAPSETAERQADFYTNVEVDQVLADISEMERRDVYAGWTTWTNLFDIESYIPQTNA